MILKFILILSVTFSVQLCYAQYDTVKKGVYFSREMSKEHIDGNVHIDSIVNTAIPIPFNRGNYLTDLFYFKRFLPMLLKNRDSVLINDRIVFSNSTFYKPAKTYSIDIRPFTGDYYGKFIFNEDFVVEDLGLDEPKAEFRLENGSFNNDFNLTYSTLYDLEFNNCIGGFKIDHDSIQGDITVDGNNVAYLNKRSSLFTDNYSAPVNHFAIDYNEFTKPLTFIDLSNISLESFFHMSTNNYFKILFIKLENDSLNGGIWLERYELADSADDSVAMRSSVHLVARNCYINDNIEIKDFSKKISVEFENCTFGPRFSYFDLKCDTLRFINCFKLPAHAALSFVPNNGSSMLEIYNTNLSDISFVYSEGTNLLFEHDSTPDGISNVYEGLISKLKGESKFDSHERVDIQYRNWKASAGNWWDKSVNFIDKVWWNHGYSKGYIIIWTFGFLFFFFLVNMANWKSIQSMYPINSSLVLLGSKFAHPIKYKLRKAISIFLYTSFIFFSFKVDFEKLKAKPASLVGYFFIQYFVGLGCVFFIVNAILKVGQ